MATPYFRRPHMTGRNGFHSHLTPWASVAVRSNQPTHTHTANAPSYSWLVEAVECSGRARIPEDIWGGFSVGNSHSATPAHSWQYALDHWACIRYTLYAISVCALCIMFCGLCGLSTMVLLSPFTTLGAGRWTFVSIAFFATPPSHTKVSEGCIRTRNVCLSHHHTTPPNRLGAPHSVTHTFCWKIGLWPCKTCCI